MDRIGTRSTPPGGFSLKVSFVPLSHSKNLAWSLAAFLIKHGQTRSVNFRENGIMPIKSLWSGGWTLAAATVLNPGFLVAQDGATHSVDEVRAVMKRQVDDWNKGDLDGFLGGYWNSPRVVFQSGGQRYDGWESMRSRYRQRYQAEGRAMGRLEFNGLEIELLGPQTALAWRVAIDNARRYPARRIIHRDLP